MVLSQLALRVLTEGFNKLVEQRGPKTIFDQLQVAPLDLFDDITFLCLFGNFSCAIFPHELASITNEDIAQFIEHMWHIISDELNCVS